MPAKEETPLLKKLCFLCNCKFVTELYTHTANGVAKIWQLFGSFSPQQYFILTVRIHTKHKNKCTIFTAQNVVNFLPEK
jgi:hypothetical protein